MVLGELTLPCSKTGLDGRKWTISASLKGSISSSMVVVWNWNRKAENSSRKSEPLAPHSQARNQKTSGVNGKSNSQGRKCIPERQLRECICWKRISTHSSTTSGHPITTASLPTSLALAVPTARFPLQ
jgi:hypothetical protein